MPAIDTVELLARALGLSPCYLAYGVEGPPLPEGDAPRAGGCGERLQALRRRRGLSKLGLAAAADVGGSAILPIEAGQVRPTAATLEQLAQGLGCSPCWLAFGEGADPLQDPEQAAAEAAAVKYRPPRKPGARPEAT